MKNNILLLIVSLAITTTLFAQNKKIEKIEISHTYEDLYISYIVPVNCNELQKHGPILVEDSILLSEISKLLNASEPCDKQQDLDIRFKIKIFFKDEIRTLCFGRPDEGMWYLNKVFKYNDELCSYLINIIKETGAIEPEWPPMPPQ